MKTVKSKVIVYNCKTGKTEVVEKELPVFDPPKPQPSPLETVLYHVCKMLGSDDKVLKEFVTQYENTFGSSTVKSLFTINEISESYSESIKVDSSGNSTPVSKVINVPPGISEIIITGKMCNARGNQWHYPAILEVVADGETQYSISTGKETCINIDETITILNKTSNVTIVMKCGGGVYDGTSTGDLTASFNVDVKVKHLSL